MASWDGQKAGMEVERNMAGGNPPPKPSIVLSDLRPGSWEKGGSEVASTEPS